MALVNRFLSKLCKNKESSEFITIRVLYLSSKGTVTYNNHATDIQTNIQSWEASYGSCPCVPPRVQWTDNSKDFPYSVVRMLRTALLPNKTIIWFIYRWPSSEHLRGRGRSLPHQLEPRWGQPHTNKGHFDKQKVKTYIFHCKQKEQRGKRLIKEWIVKNLKNKEFGIKRTRERERVRERVREREN